MDNGSINVHGDDSSTSIDTRTARGLSSMRLPWSSTIDTTDPTAPAHSRSVSGGLLSGLGRFLRPAAPESDEWLKRGDAPRSKTSIDDEDGSEVRSRVAAKTRLLDDDTRRLAVLQRTRKGSLRKSALLGGKRMGVDGRERRHPTQQLVEEHAKQAVPGDANEKSAKPSVDAVSAAAATPEDSGQSESTTLQDGEVNDTLLHTSEDKHAPGYVSTTEDDEDVLTFNRPAKPVTAASAASLPSAAAATSYFPPQLSRQRTRSAHQLHQPALQDTRSPDPETYSYTETEYWGWVILIVTWLVFTVGMGSCLDIWSWAWDIGETPYAPPELEDDPTLPIVGYYPALIVLSGVVAWAWITVAWVGMKYFRHAKIEDIR